MGDGARVSVRGMGDFFGMDGGIRCLSPFYNNFENNIYYFC